jgi:putative NADPH-quinone reductase
MNIVMLTGSPHKNGTSMLLADEFEKGAREKGHQMTRFNAAFMKVSGCRGCDYCTEHNGDCVLKDDMQAVYKPLLEAGLVVFVTPLYYWDMAAQLKSVVDRFYSVDRALTTPPKDTMLLATCHSSEPWAFDALKEHYKALQRHLNWQDRGILLAQGMGVRADIENSEYPLKAREMGLGL